MPKKIESAGELDRRIEIVRQVGAGKDDDGFPLPAHDEPVCRPWARVRDGTFQANEHFTASVGHLVSTMDFTIRYAAMVKYGIVEGMYVIYAGKRHRILKIYDPDHAYDYVTLNTETEKATNG